MKEEHKMYEIGYLLNPLLAEENLENEVSAMRKLIEDGKGFIINEGRPRMLRLAYAIQKIDNAHFGWLKFSSGSESILDIQNDFKKNKNIIRFLITIAHKENMMARSPKIMAKRKKPVVAEKDKPSIKPEEIDKKLEELLGE